MVLWINRLPYKPGVAGSIPSLTSLSDETFKLWPSLTLAVGGMLKHTKKNQQHRIKKLLVRSTSVGSYLIIIP